MPARLARAGCGVLGFLAVSRTLLWRRIEPCLSTILLSANWNCWLLDTRWSRARVEFACERSSVGRVPSCFLCAESADCEMGQWYSRIRVWTRRFVQMKHWNTNFRFGIRWFPSSLISHLSQFKKHFQFLSLWTFSFPNSSQNAFLKSVVLQHGRVGHSDCESGTNCCARSSSGCSRCCGAVERETSFWTVARALWKCGDGWVSHPLYPFNIPSPIAQL